MRDRIYGYINRELRGEKKEADTEEQFIYKTRKKGFGVFKKDMWNLAPDVLEAIGTELEDQFTFLFDQLNVFGTKDVVERYLKPVDIPLEIPESLKY